MKAALDRAVALIRGGERFLVCPHRRPDGDALGSALGLAAVLVDLGKQATVYSPDPLPFSLEFLPDVDRIARTLPEGQFDATFVTDTAAPELLPDGFPDRDVSGPVVVLDHHLAHADFGDVVLRDVDACATGVVVLALLRALEVNRLSKSAATSIYAAIVADTGGFRYPGTDAQTLRSAAELLEVGVDPWEVAYNLFEGWPRERMELLREVLASMELLLDGRLVVLRVPRAMLEDTGAGGDMVDGLVNYGRRIAGVEIAALLVEDQDDGGDGAPVTRVSLRSRGGVDVAQLAVALGGGGHRAAAGATIRSPLAAASARVVEEATRVLSSN